MPRSKKAGKNNGKKRKLSGNNNTSSVYNEDIGTMGIKKTSSSGHQNHAPTAIHKFKVTKKEKRQRTQRMERFAATGSSSQLQSSREVEEDDEPNFLYAALSSSRLRQGDTTNDGGNNSGHEKLVGTSTALEKPYFRLTTYPKAENVRPLRVLKKSLVHVKGEFVKREDFEWTNEQLKSIRQDLTVQGIRTEFVLEVYETHARILLEQGELNEFHQCQTMIRNLTSGRQASSNETGNGIGEFDAFTANLKQQHGPADEFQAYGILYNIVQNSWGEVQNILSSCNQGGAHHLETNLETKKKSGDGTKQVSSNRGGASRHAVYVMKAVIHDDYQSFFRLYEQAPHLSAYLMDFLVRRVRVNAYQRIVAAYRPTVSVEHFRESLFFQDLEETRRFLKKNGACFVKEPGEPPFWIDCKATAAKAAS